MRQDGLGELQIGGVTIRFHRTVRVAEGRQPSNLPPSLGYFPLYRVSDYREKAPESWETGGFFFPMHDKEAMWMSFHALPPVALLIGAGGINAISGEPLGTNLIKDGYIATPPQPWLDGWKSPKGTVYQFVAAPYEEGKGITVGEQVLGDKSITGGLGIAVFQAKEPEKLHFEKMPHELWGTEAWGSTPYYSAHATLSSTKGMSATVKLGPEARLYHAEMGLGKGGEIIQKIYPDPYGLEVWKDATEVTTAVYLVNAKLFSEITGLQFPEPVGHESYQGKWFGLDDQPLQDVPGTEKFVGLKSVFQEEKK